MKNLLLAVIIFLGILSYAQDSTAKVKMDSTKNDPIAIVSNKPNHYQLIYFSNSKGNVRVSIFTENGSRLRTDYLKNTNGYNIAYDFSELPKGIYHVRVLDGRKSFRKTIAHNEDIPANLNITITSVGNEKKYDVKVERDNMKPVWVNIYDAYSQIIYREEIDVDYNFSRMYDLSKFPSKATSIEVYSDGKLAKKAIN